ncbi:MAG: deoxynucleoside kinase [Bacteroidetes bacterium]|nr:deoxynucleoside kinase [Bacteroidota bacterium]
MMNTYEFIAIEGVIGAGKTSLANLLAKERNAKLVLEEFKDNPFLDKFYIDRERYAFQTQLTFLASRFQQQQNIYLKDLFHSSVISDYIFDKDRIFARINLNGDELALYDKIFQIMSFKAPKPDLVIYLQSSLDRLLHNIHKRGRSYEKDMDPDYLNELNEAYNHFFHHYNRSQLIIINASEIDFVTNTDHLDYIIRNVFEAPLKAQTTYLSPK